MDEEEAELSELTVPDFGGLAFRLGDRDKDLAEHLGDAGVIDPILFVVEEGETDNIGDPVDFPIIAVDFLDGFIIDLGDIDFEVGFDPQISEGGLHNMAIAFFEVIKSWVYGVIKI